MPTGSSVAASLTTASNPCRAAPPSAGAVRLSTVTVMRTVSPGPNALGASMATPPDPLSRSNERWHVAHVAGRLSPGIGSPANPGSAPPEFVRPTDGARTMPRTPARPTRAREGVIAGGGGSGRSIGWAVRRLYRTRTTRASARPAPDTRRTS